MNTFEKRLTFSVFIMTALIAALYGLRSSPQSADLSDLFQPALRCSKATRLPIHEERLACHDFCKNVEKYLGVAKLAQLDVCKADNQLTL